MPHRLRAVASAVWLAFLVLFALANAAVVATGEIGEYGHENRAPGLTLALGLLAEAAALVSIAVWFRARRERGRPAAASVVAAGLASTAAAIALFFFAVLVAFAAGPH